MVEEEGTKEQQVRIKHGNPFLAAFKGILGKGLGCFTLIVIAVLVFAFFSSNGSKKVVVTEMSLPAEETIEGKVEKKADQAEIIKTHWEAYTNSIGTHWAIVTGIIKNTGETNIRLDEASGSVYNAEGKVVGNSSESIYPRIITPGQEAYVAAQIMDTVPKSEIADAKLQFSFKETNQEPSRINALNDSGRRTKYDYTVTGELENPTGEEIKDVRALALFFDKAGNLINVETAYPEPDILPAGGTISFKASAMHLEDLIADYRVVGYSMEWSF